MKRLLFMLVIVLSGMATSWGGEVEFVEDFALAKDRETALKQLIPGTEDFYYWNCLHLLHTEQFEQVDAFLEAWVQRHGETDRVWEIRTRRALLAYERNPEKTLEYLRGRFGIHYPHQKEELGADPDLPTSLDAALISREQYKQRALQRHPNSLNGFEDSSLDWLVADQLNADQRRQLLSRLSRPDHPRLVQLVADDLAAPDSQGFGSHGIHRQMLRAQLDELLTLKPDLLNEQQFVRIYLTKLQPNPDVDWRRDPGETAKFLDRMLTFADQLAPVHNSLKAHLLYHRLLLERSQGHYDKERFLAYLRLPRPAGYISKVLRESQQLKNFPCDLNTNYDNATLLSPVVNDEPLVRDYLAHFLLDAADAREFEPYVDNVYLRHLLAETKIVNGLGDGEQWASLLPPEPFRQLKQRVDIDFAFANKTQFTLDDPITLDVHIKNVSTLIVKVFEINTRNFYRQHLREVDTDINLDGLVANVEQTYQYDESPFRRVRRTFDFPTLDKPGVFVIDFIGNGQSSRALVRKGMLRHLVRTTPAGQSFTILDQNNRQVDNASIWLSGHEYSSGKDGSIAIPFSTNPGRQPIVITAPAPGAEGTTYSSLGFFNHEPENYQFTAGFYVDREALLTRRTAELVVRPGLAVNGTPVSLKLLEEIKLTITSTDLDGTSSAQEIRDFELFEDRESTHQFQVPPRLATLNLHLSAKIRQVTTATQVDVATGAQFSLNGIRRTEKISDLHLLKSDDQYVLELRGRSGEPRVSRPVVLQIKHRDFRDTVDALLKSDPRGHIILGPLTDIVSLTAKDPDGVEHAWTLVGDRHNYQRTVHGKVGEPIVLPYLGSASQPQRGELSLLELTGGTFTTDRFDHLRIQDSLLFVERLPEGDYDLVLKATDTHITLRVTDGQQLGRFLIGSLRQLETKPLKPLQIESITPSDDKVSIKLQNVSQYARVHVFATRYLPEYDAYDHLSQVRDVEPYLFWQTPASSVYLTGRNIGDEYRYIIDRKYAAKYPGNMLQRPSLLLNPWAVRETQTGEQLAAAGGDFGEEGEKPEAEARRDAPAESEPPRHADHFADLDFLGDTSTVLLNLIPNEEGVVEVPRETLGDRHFLRVVAVDPLNTTSRSLALSAPDATPVDLRLANGLDPQKHFTQQKQISIVPAGQAFTLHDIATARFESYDSLGRVFALYATLHKDPKLVEFSFITNWPKLEPEEKREKYSKYASHELSFFLFQKDPKFFQSVIKPYLANKKHKTFMDHFLLGDDLTEYLQPWNFGQLNIVERILLARRIEGERAQTSRHVSDLHALLPPDVDRFIFLFDTAVQRSALEMGDELGLKQALERVEQLSELKMDLSDLDRNGVAPMDAAAAPAAPAGAAGAVADGAVTMLGRGAARPSLMRARGLGEAKGKVAESEKSPSRRFGGGGRSAGTELAFATEDRAAVQFFDESLVAKRELLRQLYREIDKTREWAENNYHHLTIDQQTAALITVNAFWKDFAAHDPNTPFLSKNLAEASRNFPEILLALAVLDLPFEAPQHDSKFDGAQMTLVPGGPLVVFHEEIQAATAAEDVAKLLVSQNFFKHGDRQQTVNGETVDKFVTDEFLVHTVYGCHVVITNPTSTKQKMNVLIQIPRGAIPVLNSQATKTLHIDLEPYHTQTVEYHFYFPLAGSFAHFPVHVAKNEQLVAAAEPVALTVVDRPTKADSQSWDYISQYGSLSDVLAFLDKHNVNELNLERIAWRMHDRASFDAITTLLAGRHVYQHTLWSYALLHNVVPAAREYLQHADQIVNQCGGPLQSPLLTIDTVARRMYQHLEYKPLVNARTHALGQRRQIVNDRLHAQYHHFLKQLAYQPSLGDDDLLTVTYYLLLQDRVEEALPAFAQVDRAKVATQMQYDYCAAYLKFFSDEPEQAREIAAGYVDHGVDRWRNIFAAIVAQLDEATGETVGPVDAENRDQQQGQLAATAAAFDFTVESRKIRLNYQNLTAVKVNFYEVDVELLFSRNPFVQQYGGDFASIKPNLALDVPLPADASSAVIDLPEALSNRNVLIELVGAGQTKTQPHFSNSLSVRIIENYGQVQAAQLDTHEPISKAYVKVYIKTARGEVKFYKDGYTDLRGRFDYASLSTDELDSVEKFAILVLSDQCGAVVREAAPPKR